MKCTDLSKADSFHNVFVCQRQNLISTHCIPHLSAKVHKGAVNSDLTLCLSVCVCVSVICVNAEAALYKRQSQKTHICRKLIQSSVCKTVSSVTYM